MAEKKLFNTVSESLTNDQKEKLEEIITSQHPSESNKTIFNKAVYMKKRRHFLLSPTFKFKKKWTFPILRNVTTIICCKRIVGGQEHVPLKDKNMYPLPLHSPFSISF